MMAVTGAFIVFSTFPGSSATGLSFSFASRDFTNTICIGHIFGRRWPHFRQVVNLLQQGVIDRLAEPNIVRSGFAVGMRSRQSSFAIWLMLIPFVDRGGAGSTLNWPRDFTRFSIHPPKLHFAQRTGS